MWFWCEWRVSRLFEIYKKISTAQFIISDVLINRNGMAVWLLFYFGLFAHFYELVLLVMKPNEIWPFNISRFFIFGIGQYIFSYVSQMSVRLSVCLSDRMNKLVWCGFPFRLSPFIPLHLVCLSPINRQMLAYLLRSVTLYVIMMELL